MLRATFGFPIGTFLLVPMLVALLVSICVAVRTDDRPNFVFVLTDDQRMA